jgi:DNA-binding NtrC family response regulator
MKRAVLVIDRDQSTRVALKNELNSTFDVCAASSYGEGRSVLQRRGGWAAVIAEARLGPTATGIDLLREIATQCAGIGRILLSADVPFDWAVRLLEEGIAHRLVPKPWGPFEVQEALEAVVELASRER